MVLVLHGAVIALVMFSRPIARIGATPGLIAFTVPASGTRAPHPAPHPDHPRVATTPVEPPAPLLEIALVDVIQSLPDILPITDAQAQDMPAAIGGGCDLTPQVQDALRHSDEVLRLTPAIPAARRSIANAIVVWNAGWIDPGPGPAQTALAAIRHTIEQSVAASSADCRGQLQSGPRLIYLPDSSGKTTVLALGSGQWNWQQLSAGAMPQSADTAQVAMAPPPSATLPSATLPARLPSAGAPDHTPALNALLASLIGKRSPTSAPSYP